MPVQQMNEARRRQLEILRNWSPQERLRRGMELTAMCCAARDSRIQRQHPQASQEELQALRLREILSRLPTR
jgi:hypothetical protein